MALPIKRNKVLPTTGVPASELVALMREFHAQDVPRWKDGKASGAVRKLSSLFRRQDTPSPRILHARRATLHPQLTCCVCVCVCVRVQVYHGGEEHMALQDEVSSPPAIRRTCCRTPWSLYAMKGDTPPTAPFKAGMPDVHCGCAHVGDERFSFSF